MRLLESLHAWAQQGVKGVWLKLPIHLSQLVPVAVKHGFEYHSAAADRVVLCRWLPASSSLLPNGPTAQVGVGAYILSSDNKILLVMEACGPAAAAGMWKIPTGLVELREDIGAAIVREVLEETGLHVTFVGVLGFLRRCAAMLHNTNLVSNHCCRGGIAVGGFDDMFITCACTIESSSQDAVLQLQPGELAGVLRRTAAHGSRFTPTRTQVPSG